jgi:hypothetical protein
MPDMSRAIRYGELAAGAVFWGAIYWFGLLLLAAMMLEFLGFHVDGNTFSPWTWDISNGDPATTGSFGRWGSEGICTETTHGLDC